MPLPLARPVTILAAGGTIAMRGAELGGAGEVSPEMGAEDLVAAIPVLAGIDLRVRTIATKASAQLAATDVLTLAHAAAAEAAAGRGVVITHGTDTLEETAQLCDLVHDGDAPVVLTGAMRAATAPGADGPANLVDAITVAGHEAAAGLGALVVFAGEIHAARGVRKAHSTALQAFDSPRWGPIGRIDEQRIHLSQRPERSVTVVPHRFDARVHVVQAGLAVDGTLVGAAANAGADGLVGVLLGGGHASPQFLSALVGVARRGVPVVVTVRPGRGSILHRTYSYEGSERDVRAGRLVCAGALSSAAARVKLMACLGAGYDIPRIVEAFAPDDV